MHVLQQLSNTAGGLEGTLANFLSPWDVCKCFRGSKYRNQKNATEWIYEEKQNQWFIWTRGECSNESNRHFKVWKLSNCWLMVNQKHVFLIALKITIPILNQAKVVSVCCHLTMGSSRTFGKTYKTGQITPNSFPGINFHFQAVWGLWTSSGRGCIHNIDLNVYWWSFFSCICLMDSWAHLYLWPPQLPLAMSPTI